MIETQKNKLLKTGAKDHWDPDEDLEYINTILNSFSRQNFDHGNSNGPKLENFTPEGVLTCAPPQIRTPPKVNLKFNQNSTRGGSEEENFNYFSNLEEEGPTDLGDYFSDDEENESWDEEDHSNESDSRSQTDFYDLENFPNLQVAMPDFNQTFNQNFNQNSTSDRSKVEDFSCFSTIWEEGTTELADYYSDEEEDDSLTHEDTWSKDKPNTSEDNHKINYRKPGDKATAIFSLSVEDAQAFSTWRPFIPENSQIDHKQLLTSQSVLTGFQIGSVSQPCWPAPRPKPTTTHWPPLIRTKPCKPFYSPTYSATPTSKQPFFTKSSTKPATRSQESQDHPEPSKRYRHWKRPSQCSNETNQNQNTKPQNTPQVTNAGSEL
jgi:hypothetical protein